MKIHSQFNKDENRLEVMITEVIGDKEKYSAWYVKEPYDIRTAEMMLEGFRKLIRAIEDTKE